MTPFTAAQREALAKLVGISPETHYWLAEYRCDDCDGMVQGLQDDGGVIGCECCGHEIDPSSNAMNTPCPMTGVDEADDVWLAPVMRFLLPKWQFGIGPSHADNPLEKWISRMGYDHDIVYAPYATAALALCERWDMAWERVYDEDADHGFATIMVYPENDRFDCDESDTCKFPRALLNAACAAMHAKEMADG